MTHVVTLVIDGQVIATNYSEHSMGKTLRLAWELLGGIPQAECCIRREGELVGYLHTNFRGELDEAEVYGPTYRMSDGLTYKVTRVTPLNPHGPIFLGVFA